MSTRRVSCGNHQGPRSSGGAVLTTPRVELRRPPGPRLPQTGGRQGRHHFLLGAGRPGQGSPFPQALAALGGQPSSACLAPRLPRQRRLPWFGRWRSLEVQLWLRQHWELACEELRPEGRLSRGSRDLSGVGEIWMVPCGQPLALPVLRRHRKTPAWCASSWTASLQNHTNFYGL